MTKLMGMRRLARTTWVVALAAVVSTLLGVSALSAETGGVATRTTLTTESIQAGGRTVTAYSATVTGEDGAPAKGVVVLSEQGKMLASAALDASGTAYIRADGLSGNHRVSATYNGDQTHAVSQSETVAVHSDAIASDAFALAVNPGSVTLASPGEAATFTATITPGSAFTGFVALSCAGAPVSAGSTTDNALPVGVTCTFTPENLQVSSSAQAFTSSFSLVTTAPAGANARNRDQNPLNQGAPVALAILLPGMAALGWIGRKRKLLSRITMLAFVGVITVLGTSSCAARYKYLHHPPTYNGGTPTGSYTITVWAQTSDGVNASEVFTTLALTVN